MTGWAPDLSAKGGAEDACRLIADRGRNGLQGCAATRTRIGDDAYDKYPDAIQQIVEMTAPGRPGEADDVGAVIAAVLSDDFRWVTGQNIEASGGARLSVAS